jgi:hypothetical protein
VASPSGPKHERRSDAGKGEQLLDAIAQDLKGGLAESRLQDDQGEQHLKAKSPDDDSRADRLAIRGKQVCESKNANQPDDRLEFRQQKVHLESFRASYTQPITSGSSAGASSPISMA